MRTILLLFIVFTLASCKKLEDITMPEFEVTASKDSYHVGDEVSFNFKGDADVISVYTGELGYDHAYSASDRVLSSKFNVSFESQALDGTQRDQLYIYLIKNFNGDYSMNGIEAVRTSMIELNDRLRTAGPDDNRQWINSGLGNISEYLDMSQPSTIYFAVRHLVRDQNVYGTGNLNRVRNFKLLASNELGETTIFSQLVDNWHLFSSPNKMPGRATLDATNPPQMTLRQGFGAAYVSETTEDWVVSNPIQIVPTTNMGPDHAIGIKSLADAMPKTYTKIYNKAGDYTVVFKAVNQSIAGRKEVLREVKIHIEP